MKGGVFRQAELPLVLGHDTLEGRFPRIAGRGKGAEESGQETRYDSEKQCDLAM